MHVGGAVMTHEVMTHESMTQCHEVMSHESMWEVADSSSGAVQCSCVLEAVTFIRACGDAAPARSRNILTHNDGWCWCLWLGG